ncbi:MAG: GNAT family N-acetyltransferase [Spirochaetes bacterium]|nr:GNAT family N-acetyltransferase [Spirochaetota bacterium]
MAEIRLLKEYPHFASVLGLWAYREWYGNRDIDPKTVIMSYQARISDGKLPVAMVALENGVLAGMVSLKENDLWSRKDLNPWLASLYVSPEYRSCGIGTGLIIYLIEYSKNLGIKRLYLFTWENLKGYYTSRGWEYLENAPGNDGGEVMIFYYDIS